MTPIPIVALIRLLQSLKAPPPMLVTLSGIVMLVRLLQSLKAQVPMLVTLSGILMLVRLVQSWKAEPAINFICAPLTEVGIFIGPLALLPSIK